MGIRLFITGAGGYLGGVLAAGLATLPGVTGVTGMVNRSRPAMPLPDNVKLIELDVRSPELADAMAGHDVVIHSAFVVQWLKRMPAAVRDEINLGGTRNVAQAAVKNRAARLLYASSCAVYDPRAVHGKENVSEEAPLNQGDTPMYYWNSKAIAERLLLAALAGSGVILTRFRMSYIIGPYNRATAPGFRANAVLFPGYNPRTQFVHEDDVVQAFALALRAELPGAFNVVPDDAIPMADAFKLMGAQPRRIPIWLARLVSFVRWNYLDSPTHPSWVRATLVDFTSSNAKLKATGWTPRYTSVEAIRSAL